jgi:cephalosporin hydroxylase
MRYYYWESIDVNGQMFDFEEFYFGVASSSCPDNCRIVEVGIANGKSIIYLAEQLLNNGKSIDRIIGVDNCAYGGQEQRNEVIRHIIGSKTPVEFMEMSSLDASTKFPDQYLDFVFLDSSHLYAQTKVEIVLWYQKLKHGGIIAGHDFNEYPNDVALAVKELFGDNFHVEDTKNGFGIWWTIKTPDLKLNF